jgi:hypothetical protein
MFESKCPGSLDGTSSLHYDSFEERSNYHSDFRVRSTEAFCGRYALLNPSLIYNDPQGTQLIRYGTVIIIMFQIINRSAIKEMFPFIVFLRLKRRYSYGFMPFTLSIYFDLNPL